MRYLAAFLVLVLPAVAVAQPPRIDNVSARPSGDGTWRISVTISHPDTGWDHYADAWRVLDMDGNEIAIRELAHPHVDEQPFTRSVSGVRIPQDADRIQIQARDKPGGWNPTAVTVKIR